MSSERILLVDDQQAMLDGLRRQLRREFQVEAALGGHDALHIIEMEGPFAVVVSDLRMPYMDGIEFFTTLQHRAPATARILLTGNADLQVAIEAVNNGHIFRLLAKPCSLDALSKALHAGIEHYRLHLAPQELLEQTLRGSVEVLSDIIALVNPEAFGRSAKIQSLVREMASHMALSTIWVYEVSAMLSQLGCLILPKDILQKVRAGHPLTDEETELFLQHPSVGSDLLRRIPRMDEVVASIAYQEKHFDGSGIPRDTCSGTAIPLGARLLKVALDFEALESTGMAKSDIVTTLSSRKGYYDPAVLDALQFGCPTSLGFEQCEVPIANLEPSYLVAEDVKTISGTLICPKGQPVTPALQTLLTNCARTGHVKESLSVLIPLSDNSLQPIVG